MAVGKATRRECDICYLHPSLNCKVKVIHADGKVISVLPVYFRRVIFSNSDVGLDVSSIKVKTSCSGKPLACISDKL